MPNVNLSFDAQQNAINRKRALAQALQQQALQPMEMPQYPGANVNALQGLTPIVQALVAGLTNRKLDKKQSALDTQIQTDRSGKATALVRSLMPPAEGVGDEAPRNDRIAALSAALASGDPMQQRAAEMQLQGIQQREQATRENDMALARQSQNQFFQTKERLAGQEFTSAQNAENRKNNPPEVTPGGYVFQNGQWTQVGTPKPPDETPEERFVSLKLREEATKFGGSLSPTQEAAARKAARAEWTEAGRENNPKMDELMLQLKALQIEQAEQRLKAAQGDGGLTPKQLGSVLSLSNSLKSHPAYTDMLDISMGMKGVEAGLSQKNGFGDITAMNAFQRMADPGATVRSEDVKLMQSASSLINRIFSEYPIEKLRTGAKLPEAVRAQINETAKTLYDVRARNYNETVGQQYKALAGAAKIPFEYVGQDFAVRPQGAAPAPAAGPDAFTLPNGTVVRRQPDGTYR